MIDKGDGTEILVCGEGLDTFTVRHNKVTGALMFQGFPDLPGNNPEPGPAWPSYPDVTRQTEALK